MNHPVRANRFMFFLLLYHIFLLGSLLVVLMKFTGLGKTSIPQQIILGQLLSFVIPFIVYQLITKQPFKKIIPLNSLGITNFGLIILMCICIQPFMMFISAISSLLAKNNVSSIISQVDSSQMLLLVFTISVCPAILEEITFRGIILQNYRKVGIKKAAMISGLFFGIIHMDLQQFFYAFLLGILFSYFVHYTKSIFSSMLAHFTINFIQVALFALSKLAIESQGLDINTVTNETSNSISLAPILYLLIISVVFAFPFFILFTSFIKHNLVQNSNKDISTKHFGDEYEELNIVFTNQKIFTPSFFAVILLFVLNIGINMALLK